MRRDGKIILNLLEDIRVTFELCLQSSELRYTANTQLEHRSLISSSFSEVWLNTYNTVHARYTGTGERRSPLSVQRRK